MGTQSVGSMAYQTYVALVALIGDSKTSPERMEILTRSAANMYQIYAMEREYEAKQETGAKEKVAK